MAHNTHPNSIAALHAHRVPEVKRKKARINHISILELIKVLEPGTLTCKELAEESGLHYVTVLEFCRTAHRRKMIHLAMFEKDSRGRDTVKIYKWGKGTDAKRTSISAKDRSAAYRKKKAQQEFNSMMTGVNTNVHNETE